MLATTRFNCRTYCEKEEYRRRYDIPCIYGSPVMIKKTIPLKTRLYVVEMNNEENKIMGIGLIRNMAHDSCDIYTDPNYNRFIYMGKYRMTREEMEAIDDETVKLFDLILFKGYTHVKRHFGITIIPPKLLMCERVGDVDLLERVRTMFKSFS